jgi:hypothetical protein
MHLTCNEALDLIDAGSMDALDASEQAALGAHLGTCRDCARVADLARESAHALALAVPLHQASPLLKVRIMAEAAGTGEARTRRTVTFGRYWQAAAAAVAVVGLGLGAWGVSMQNDINNLQDQRTTAFASVSTAESRYATVSTQLTMASDENATLVRTNDIVTEIVTEPDAERLAMAPTDASPGSAGRYVWSRSAGMGSLVARDLPPLEEGETYCLWLVYENDWILGGAFGVDENGTGRVIVDGIRASSETLGALAGYAVSIETDDGDIQHEGVTVLEGSIPE